MDYPIHIYEPSSKGKTVVCLLHGNGFPPLAYAPLAESLGEAYRVVCLPSRPLWGDQDPEQFTSWEVLADDLVAGIQAHSLAPVIGVGHSMGGVATLVAAVKHPELFRAIVLVDPVYVPRWYIAAVRVYHLLGWQPYAHMVNGALKRQRHWSSFDEAYERFRRRSLFARCSDEVVRLYTQGITRQNGKGVDLIYPPEWEAKIYGTGPIGEWAYPPKLRVPSLILGGAESDVFTAPSINLWRKMRPDVNVTLIPESGHLLPLEKPEVVAHNIREFLSTLSR